MKHIFSTIIIAVISSTATLGAWYYFIEHQTLNNASQLSVSPEMVIRSIPDVVASSTPAVVSIVITADVPIIERYYEDLRSPFGGFFGGNLQIPRERQIGTERQEIGGGTGFFVSPDGYLVTNKHVVDQDGVDYTVVTNEGKTFEVAVIAKDPTLDVAILNVETNDAVSEFPYLTFAPSEDITLGETVIAIGNALAEFPNSVSVGVISGLSRDIIAGDGWFFRESLEGVIQTDAAINQGNSGGPLLNTDGEVIGVNVAVAGGGENIGFALPSTMVSSVYQSVAKHGEIVRPFLGVRTLVLDEFIAERNSLPVDYGHLIIPGPERGDLAVVPGSPAYKAGLEENDIILAINGETLDKERSLAAVIRQFSAGETVTLTVLHNGEEKEVTVTLDQR